MQSWTICSEPRILKKIRSHLHSLYLIFVKKQSQGIIIVLKHFFFKVNICKSSLFHLIIWVLFPYVHLTAQIFILNNLFCLFIFLWFLTKFLKLFFIDFDGYYIVRTDEGQPRPKYIFSNKHLVFLLYRGLVHHHHRILNLNYN